VGFKHVFGLFGLPQHPFIQSVGHGASVGPGVGAVVGAAVGTSVGAAVGAAVGDTVGTCVSPTFVGVDVGAAVGSVGTAVGTAVGEAVGFGVAGTLHSQMSSLLVTSKSQPLLPPDFTQLSSASSHEPTQSSPPCCAAQ
jgi:hypothetical protein